MRLGFEACGAKLSKKITSPGAVGTGLQAQPVLVQRLPLLADQALAVPAGGHFQAAVLHRRRIDA